MIDLSSDTASRPTEGMRRAMAAAEVGDEQKDEDPSTRALLGRAAELLGHEAALFLPTGTMCNLVALAVHARPGDEVICARNAHIYASEAAGGAVVAGLSFATVDCVDGILGPEALKAALRRPRPRSPRSRVVVMEQTSNRSGGTVWPLETMSSVAEIARAAGLAVHVDGARLMNASVASGVAAEAYGACADSIWLDLTKGLGCPVGAVLAGSRAFIDEAWVWKHRLGGAMRQSGILAAAGIYALDHHVERLAEDHENMRRFARAVSSSPGLSLSAAEPATNIAMLDLDPAGIDAQSLNERLLLDGVRLSVEGPFRLRAVTHIDVTREQAAAAAELVCRILGEANRALS